ncbi:MAG: LPXTG cell wall anchor domain-containing protein [Lactobacillus crispatus]|nr:LPXTG cell wall anchor domain-containing protein [Lactobacillus crispatus]
MAKISKLGLAGSALLASASGLSIVSSSLVTAHASESQAQSNVPTKEGTYSKKVALIDENGKQVGTTTLTIKVGAFNLVQPTLSNDIPEGYGILKTNNLEAYPDSIKVAKKLPAGTTTKKIKVVDKKTGAQKEDTLTRTVDKLGNYAITIGDSKNFRPDGYYVVDMNELKSFPDQVTVEFNIDLSDLCDGLPDRFTTVHVDNFYNPVLDRNNYVRTYSKKVKLVDKQGKSLGTANLIKQFTDLSKYPYQEAHDPNIVLNEPGKVALDNMPKGYEFEGEQANELDSFDTNLPDQIVLSQITANDKDKPLTSIDISDHRDRTVQRKQVKLVDKQGNSLGYAYRVLTTYTHPIGDTPYMGGIRTPISYSRVNFVGIPNGYQVDPSSNIEGDTVVLVKSAGADKGKTDNIGSATDKSNTTTPSKGNQGQQSGTNTDQGKADDTKKDDSKVTSDPNKGQTGTTTDSKQSNTGTTTPSDGKQSSTNTDKTDGKNNQQGGTTTDTGKGTATDQGKTDTTKTDNQDQPSNATTGNNTTVGDNNQQTDSGNVTVSGGNTTVNVSDGKQSSATDQGKTSDGTITNTADKGQQSGDASQAESTTNASDNKQTATTTDPSVNTGNTGSKTSTATKNDSVISSNSVKSNSTASNATDKAKSDDLVAHGQSNAGKAKAAETANRAVTGKTVKTASTAKTAPKVDTANVASESGKAKVAKTNKQVATGKTKKNTANSTASSQKSDNTASTNASANVKSSSADNSSSSATLPQTGNTKSTAGIVAGGALVATMVTLGIAYSKKHRK